jgi:hypothetical protein
MSMCRTRRRMRQSVGDILVNAIGLERVSVAVTCDESDDLEPEDLASMRFVTDHMPNVYVLQMRIRGGRICGFDVLHRRYEHACTTPMMPKFRVGPMRSPRIVLSPMLGSLVVVADPARNARDSMTVQVRRGGSVALVDELMIRDIEKPSLMANADLGARRTLMSSTSQIVARLLVAGAWRLPTPDSFAIVSQNAPTYSNPVLISFGVSDYEARRIPGVYGIVAAESSARSSER